MTNTQQKAKKELQILRKTIPDAVILDFEEEILALCEKFGNSGQSGGSAPFTASALSSAIKKLCLQEPLSEIMGLDEEWGEEFYGTRQNLRDGALFKDKDDKCRYLYAIIWQGEESWDTFTGSVYLDEEDFELLSSSQKVKFPFTPKKFYVDVIRKSITKEEAEAKKLHYIEDGFGECYYTVVKDKTQLDEVFKYYER